MHTLIFDATLIVPLGAAGSDESLCRGVGHAPRRARFTAS